MSSITLELNQESSTSMKLKHDSFPVIIDRPEEKGGAGKGLMGGQYLLLGVGGCFCSNLFAAAIAREIKIEGLKVIVSATISEAAPTRFTDIDLKVIYQRCSEPESFPKLLQIAEKGCISVNTITKGVNFTLNEGVSL